MKNVIYLLFVIVISLGGCKSGTTPYVGKNNSLFILADATSESLYDSCKVLIGNEFSSWYKRENIHPSHKADKLSLAVYCFSDPMKFAPASCNLFIPEDEKKSIAGRRVDQIFSKQKIGKVINKAIFDAKPESATSEIANASGMAMLELNKQSGTKTLVLISDLVEFHSKKDNFLLSIPARNDVVNSLKRNIQPYVLNQLKPDSKINVHVIWLTNKNMSIQQRQKLSLYWQEAFTKLGASTVQFHSSFNTIKL